MSQQPPLITLVKPNAGMEFLASQEVLDAGIAKLGLKNQRVALQFIQENIAAFGGGAEKAIV